MPVQLLSQLETSAVPATVSLLRDKDGKGTVVAMLLEEFAAIADYNAMFEDDAVASHVQRSRGYAVEKDGVLIECLPATAGAVAVLVETLPSALASRCLDVADARTGLGYYVLRCLPENTLLHRTFKEIGASVLAPADIEPLDEMAKGLYAAMRKKDGGVAPAMLDEALRTVVAGTLVRRAKVSDGTHTKGWKRYLSESAAPYGRAAARWNGKAPNTSGIKAALLEGKARQTALVEHTSSIRRDRATTRATEPRSVYEAHDPASLASRAVRAIKGVTV